MWQSCKKSMKELYTKENMIAAIVLSIIANIISYFTGYSVEASVAIVIGVMLGILFCSILIGCIFAKKCKHQWWIDTEERIFCVNCGEVKR